MPTKLSPQEFAAKWRQTSLKERSAAQEHFIDLCHLVDYETPAEADPTGESFTFEAGAKIKAEGGGMKDEKGKEISSFRLHPSSFRRGWADVWKKGYFAWEYKGKHADLDKAYQQLLQYREALQNSPLLVVSDINSIVIHTCFETFPFPRPPGQEPKDDPCVEAIAQAARELVQKRDSWLNPPDASEAELKKRTLTHLYNERPTWLDLAHQKLDRAVFDAYGWPHDLSDEEILARLLALNLERAGVEKQT